MLNYESAYKILEKYNQTHVLKYFEELSTEEQESLLFQIETLDLSVLNLFEGASDLERGKLEPLKAVTIDEINQKKDSFIVAGIEAIRAGKVATVMLAGGQGTRLGFDKAKGMFNLGETKDLYIFECQINNMLDVVKQTGAWIPLYIMTSEKNNIETMEFFKEKNYFGYNSEYITFFIQDMVASVDFDKKIYMENKHKVVMSPNGNGGWFSSMARAGILEKIKADGIEWINVFAVDNVLQRIADPAFIGSVILSGSESGAKVVSKADPDEKVGVLCLEDGMPSIVEYYEMTEEMRTRRDPDGRLSYNYGVILNYLFNVNRLEQIMNNHMPLHVVEKKIPYMNEKCEMVSPEKPNGYKFETLVLDMVHMQNSCLSYEVVRNEEFAPIKNSTGVDSVESAKLLLKENGVEF